ncbi:MAG: D-alanyl-D-alanine carboxypeptidase/D-alanyl-D-alanine-endopeptidase [Chamaesiphon sp.]|nr:D-alanyl-D-alanine carboxypeptidase/D-alanyl-D-alanine-endopeptidase [Chamaesiphon sp.]
MQQLIQKPQRVAAIVGWLFVQISILNPAQAQQPAVISPPSQPLPEVCANKLTTAINSIIDRPELRRYRWGIVVQVLGSPNQLYNRDGDRLFIPASNVKLITTAVALRQLGANTKLRTSVYQLPRSGNNSSNLLVVGRGDPSLKIIGLDSIAQQLKQRGEKQISQISFDDSYFRGEPINPDWEWGDLSTDYAPAINSLILNQNSNPLTISTPQIGLPLQYTWKNPSLNNWQVDNQITTIPAGQTSSVSAIALFGKPIVRLTGKLAQNESPVQIDLPVLKPTESFISAFRQSLVKSNLTIGTTSIVTNQNTLNLPELAAIESPPISQLINETNQNSNNVYAEVLLKSIGRTHPEHATSNEDTINLGINLVKKNLTEMGVDPQSYRLSDGSGLSRHNLAAPSAFVRVLSAMSTSPAAKIYRDSLPVSGISGSLRNRMKGKLAQGIVNAKTGSMSGVVSLSGYINPPKYSPLVFSVILNQHDQSTSQMVKIVDEIMVVLARVKQCN